MRALPVLVLVVLAAGCVSPAAVTGEVQLRADAARVSDGWAYDGQGVRLAEGIAIVDVNHRTNKGVVNFTVQDGLHTWRLAWSEFAQAPGSEFQDGGIVTNLLEHGDSGVGDTLIPAVLLKAAAWGNARLYLNGELVRDPSTGDDTLAAHFMWIEGHIRDGKGIMWNAARDGPYDPSNPSDAYVDPEGTELLIQIKSRDGGKSLFRVFEFRNVHDLSST